jgi:flavin-dependent thymidylate synthase
MRIVLAGYNIDAELVAEAAARGLDPRALTPETISAAYARISRNPAPVDELRGQARQEVAKARASNEQIVFEMGHASVAEHAVLNFDVMGVSRLAIEAIEQFRLCSYTEKSQRYITLQDDVVLPEEIAEAGLEERFRHLVAQQSRTYHLLYEKLREHVFTGEPAGRTGASCAPGGPVADKVRARALEGLAKEDARYVTPLAVEGQLGLTLNARNLELMVRRLAAHPLREVRGVAAALVEQARRVIPSLLRRTDEPRSEGRELARLTAMLLDAEGEQTLPGDTGAVQLVGSAVDGDVRVVAALLHGASTQPWLACQERAQSLSVEERADVIRAALRAAGPHDAPPRALELVALSFDLVLSASCFAQLKRHRMATLVPQRYQPELGCTMPDAISRVGLTQEFQRVMVESTRLHDAIAARAPHAAPYALTQAHRRRVLLQMSARELYHFSRLRQDHHAQWDIRALADRMLHLARQELPLTLMLACGKDRFDEMRRELFDD